MVDKIYFEYLHETATSDNSTKNKSSTYKESEQEPNMSTTIESKEQKHEYENRSRPTSPTMSLSEPKGKTALYIDALQREALYCFERCYQGCREKGEEGKSRKL